MNYKTTFFCIVIIFVFNDLNTFNFIISKQEKKYIGCLIGISLLLSSICIYYWRVVNNNDKKKVPQKQINWVNKINEIIISNDGNNDRSDNEKYIKTTQFKPELTQEEYLNRINEQYFSGLKDIITKENQGFTEDNWNNFIEQRKKKLSEDLEKLKQPLQNHRNDWTNEKAISGIEKILNLFNIMPKSLHYNTLPTEELGGKCEAFVQKKDDEYILCIHPNIDLYWESIDCSYVFYHELGHITEGHCLEHGLLRSLNISITEKNFYKHKKLKEWIADLRHFCTNEKILMKQIRDFIFAYKDRKKNENFEIGFSSQRIPDFQQMIHSLDVWWFLYESPEAYGAKLKKEYTHNAYQEALNEFFTPENIRKIQETDDSNWEIKRIKL